MKSMFSITHQLKTVVIVFILFGIMLVGCKNNDFLTEHDWIHYDSTCMETIYFGKDGHFSYYSDEGNPVKDSDLYDHYTYDPKNKEIELKPSGDMSIQVLRYEKSRLLLNIDGDIKEFFDDEDKIMNGAFPDNLIYDTEDITNDFSSYLAILNKDGSKIITAPANYDGDDPEFKEYELSETLADHAEFYSWTYDVDQSQEPMNTESSYIELTEDEATNIIRNGSAIGFVWYNAQAKITKIVFFGSTMIQ